MTKAAPTTTLRAIGCVVAVALWLSFAQHAASQPREAQTHAVQAFALAKAGNLLAAEQELRAAVRLAPENSVYLSDLASIIRALRKSDEPVALYRKALAANPSNTLIRRNLAVALIDSGDAEAATGELQHVLRANPTDAIARSAIATAYYQQNHIAKARDAVGTLMRANPDPALRIACARAALDAADDDTAEDLLLASVTHGSQKSIAYNLLGQVYWRKSRLRQAVEAYDKGIANDPLFEQNYLDLVRLLAAYNEWRPALEATRRSVPRFPASSALYELKGLIETMLLLTREAITSYERALEIDPHSVKANVGLAVSQRAAGRIDEATATFERGIQAFPKDALHRQEYGLMLLAASYSSDPMAESRGVALLEQAIALDSKLSEPEYQLGNILLSKRDTDAALKRLERAAALDPTGSKIRFALSRAYKRAGRQTEGDESFLQYERLKAAEEQSNPGFPAIRGQFQ